MGWDLPGGDVFLRAAGHPLPLKKRFTPRKFKRMSISLGWMKTMKWKQRMLLRSTGTSLESKKVWKVFFSYHHKPLQIHIKQIYTYIHDTNIYDIYIYKSGRSGGVPVCRSMAPVSNSKTAKALGSPLLCAGESGWCLWQFLRPFHRFVETWGWPDPDTKTV